MPHLGAGGQHALAVEHHASALPQQRLQRKVRHRQPARSPQHRACAQRH